MSKQDFDAIAAVLAESGNFLQAGQERREERDRIAKSLADYFKTKHPRFDRDRFLLACGVDPLDGKGGFTR